MKKTLLGYVVYFILSPSAFAVVDINTASQAELESLNGIGPAKAQAIIEYRKKSGGFKTVDELDQVPGIGQSTLDNLKKDVSVSGKKTVNADSVKTEKNLEKKKSRLKTHYPKRSPSLITAKTPFKKWSLREKYIN